LTCQQLRPQSACRHDPAHSLPLLAFSADATPFGQAVSNPSCYY
jgi:hypothetical protein